MSKVKLLVDWEYLGEPYRKGALFEPPHSAFESFMCDQEKIAVRHVPKSRGGKQYETRQMKAGTTRPEQNNAPESEEDS